jgi:hypothetical protein
MRPIKPGEAGPEMPPCARTNRCRNKDVDAYNAEVAAYNREVDNYNIAARAYLDAMNRFIQSANEYSRCELDIMNGMRPLPAPATAPRAPNDSQSHGQ